MPPAELDAKPLLHFSETIRCDLRRNSVNTGEHCEWRQLDRSFNAVNTQFEELPSDAINRNADALAASELSGLSNA